MTEHSYNGWVASKDKASIGVQDFVIDGRSFPGGVKNGDVETVLAYVVRRWDTEVESLGIPGPADEWGYSYRPNRNDPSTLSCHASGTAVDCNASHHPNGEAHTLSDAQVGRLHHILAEVDHVVKWGGDFSGTIDQMHLEIHGDAAAVKKVADRLRANPLPAWFKRNLYEGLNGDDVKAMQSRLKVGADGKFGPNTKTAVVNLQKIHNLLANGTVRPDTARVIG